MTTEVGLQKDGEIAVITVEEMKEIAVGGVRASTIFSPRAGREIRIVKKLPLRLVAGSKNTARTNDGAGQPHCDIFEKLVAIGGARGCAARKT